MFRIYHSNTGVIISQSVTVENTTAVLMFGFSNTEIKFEILSKEGKSLVPLQTCKYPDSNMGRLMFVVDETMDRIN